jgi:hypothetical protein
MSTSWLKRVNNNESAPDFGAGAVWRHWLWPDVDEVSLQDPDYDLLFRVNQRLQFKECSSGGAIVPAQRPKSALC